MNPTDATSGLQTLKALLEYHVPQLDSNWVTLLPAIIVLVAGLVLVFRGIFVVRAVLALVGAGLGGLGGPAAAGWLGSPLEVTVALCAVIGAMIVSSTYRLWLSLTTAVLVFVAVCGYQVGRDSVNQIVAPPAPAAAEVPQLKSAAEQQNPSLWRDKWGPYLESVGTRGNERFRQIPHRDLALPLLAGIAALVIGWRAPRIAAGIWVGGIGCVLAAGAGAALVSAYSPEWRDKLTASPEYVSYAAGALWAFGLLMQRGGMRRPRNAAATPPAPPVIGRRRSTA